MQASQLQREPTRTVEQDMGAPGIEPGKDRGYLDALELEETCRRCGYDVDDDGYCSLCGETTLPAVRYRR